LSVGRVHCVERSACAGRPSRVAASSTRGGFSLLDVLVSIGVIAVLISVMLPSLSMARETTRRLLCASNVRQIGLGLHMYADANRGRVPKTVVRHLLGGANAFGDQFEEGVVLRLPDTRRATAPGAWDGLGLLFEQDYLPTGPVFYCPSHPDIHRYERYAGAFAGAVDPSGEIIEIVGNYQYRGIGPRGERDLFQMPAGLALVSDSLGQPGWVNHDAGVNVLAAGLSITWFGAEQGVTGDSLLLGALGSDPTSIDDAWKAFDQGVNPDDSHDAGPAAGYGGP
jgi:type II secretory pathway pseudopilin PulG